MSRPRPDARAGRGGGARPARVPAHPGRGQEGTLAWRIIEQQFENLKNNKRADIARALKVTMEQVQEATDSLGTLSPKPGFELSAEEVKYVVPDLIVERVGEEYVAFLNDRNVPRLRINQAYQSVLKGTRSRAARSASTSTTSCRPRVADQTIEQRRRTMINVMTCIIRSSAILRQGHPVPAHAADHRPPDRGARVDGQPRHQQQVRADAARDLRAQVLLLERLTTDDGEDVSARTARDRIKNLIAEEDEGPLSDQKIADLLRGDGLNIARRTVAKYREQLRSFRPVSGAGSEV